MSTTQTKPSTKSYRSVILCLLYFLFYSQAAWAALFPEADVSNPQPANGRTGISVDTRLSWSSNAPFFSVVFGADLDEVATTIPNDMIDDTVYSPGTLEPCTTYYWRGRRRGKA